jgi:hypothetical protein
VTFVLSFDHRDLMKRNIQLWFLCSFFTASGTNRVTHIICTIKASFLCRMSVICSMRSALSVQNKILYTDIISGNNDDDNDNNDNIS